MDNSFLLIALLLIVLAVAGLLFVLLQRRRTGVDESTNMMSMLQTQVLELQKQMLQTLTSNTQSMNEQLERVRTNVGMTLSETNKVLSENIRTINEQLGRVNTSVTGGLTETKNTVIDIAKKLGELEESNKKIYEVGKDISSLQSILQAPKLRGVLGELFLGDLLSQIFPPQYFTLQHQFKNGSIVDAAIHFPTHNILCVDSKFPLESLRRFLNAQGDDAKKVARKQFVNDVKKHIDTIAAKYILPDEGTFDFALMYIPAENVYYETIIKDEEFGEEKSISTYALTKHVIPVSPNSFYAYLQAILLGLKGMEVERSAKEIIENLSRLRGDFEKFYENFDLVGKHLNNARMNFESAEKRLERFGEKLAQIEKTKEPAQLPQ
ncbi:MAG: DNA recombination protein RmuC [Bacteroidota bacterium]